MVAVAILLPCVAMWMRGRILAGIVCLILQFTLIGWIAAAVWAFTFVNNETQERRHRELMAAAAGRPRQ